MHRMNFVLALALVIMLAPVSAFAEGAIASGSVELGGVGRSTDDSKLRVDEYSDTGNDSGVEYYQKVNLEAEQNGYKLDINIDGTGSDNQDVSLEIDAKRVLRGSFGYTKMKHWLDNDQMQYLDASIPSGSAAKAYLQGLVTAMPADYTYTSDASGHYYSLPGTNDIEAAFGTNGPDGVDDPWFDADRVPSYIGYQADTGKYFAAITKDPDFKPTAALAGGTVIWQQVGRAGLYGENFLLDEDFYVEREEWKSHVDVTLPQLPNITFHAGYRVEERNGWEQSIGMSKCTTCHITGSSKDIDEETKDLTLGATGKFGILTVDYEYLNREFRVDANDPSRQYDTTYKPNPNSDYDANGGVGIFNTRTLYNYADGDLPYDTTPESDKDSHLLKARVDLPNDSTIIGSFVTSEVESKKDSEPGIWTMANDTITVDYDAYGLRATTRLGNLRLNARFKAENVETDDKQLYFIPVYNDATGNQGATGALGAPNLDAYVSLSPVYDSPANKDVVTVGLDASYRLSRYATARLGYEFEEVDRDLDAFGSTETNTIKASLTGRPAKTLRGRISYQYQNINDPFQNPDAALYEVDGLNYADNGPIPGIIGDQVGNGDSYGTMYYDERVADLTNQPEDIQETKMSLTWAPSVMFATTFTFRGKWEENDLNRSTWKQDTYSPGVSMWYAPDEKINVSFAYNYFDQRSETAFCQGFYDG